MKRTVAEIEAEYRQNVVAVVYNAEGEVWDYAFNWESAQNYALHNGYRVEAIKDDGDMTIARQQALYDAERARFNDCFGITVIVEEHDEVEEGRRERRDFFRNRDY